ncbi:MAG TPA: mRNA surveillance protein pelota [Candidatus Thermoplasmatota archaeon]|nr:mRNA surveillance protein pelota [Candidatus Thermoplasmatota archaeon]
MRVLRREPDTGTLHLRLDSVDDLWAMQALLVPGDLVTATTMRTAPESQDKAREGKPEKRTLRLGVRVEQVEWADFEDLLRVLGPIETGAQDHGKYHTIVLRADGMDVEVQKRSGLQGWHDEVLRGAVAATGQPHALLLAIDDTEAQFAVLRSYGLQFLGSLASAGQGKRHPGADEAKRAFFDDVVRSLKAFRADAQVPLLVVGPGWWREEFLEHARRKDPDSVRNAITEGTSMGGRAGLQEALRTGAVARVAKEHRVSAETEVLERVWELVAKGSDRVVYGAASVKAACEAGAVDTLLLTDAAARSGAFDDASRTAERGRASVRIVSTAHEAGKRLQEWGGAAAILRFALG